MSNPNKDRMTIATYIVMLLFVAALIGGALGATISWWYFRPPVLTEACHHTHVHNIAALALLLSFLAWALWRMTKD
jgi:hypothetical protein